MNNSFLSSVQGAQWSGTTKNRNVSTVSLAHPFAYLLIPDTHSLDSHSLLWLCSFVSSLTQLLIPELVEKQIFRCWGIRLFWAIVGRENRKKESVLVFPHCATSVITHSILFSRKWPLNHLSATRSSQSAPLSIFPGHSILSFCHRLSSIKKRGCRQTRSLLSLCSLDSFSWKVKWGYGQTKLLPSLCSLFLYVDKEMGL